jgi:hypothetical protein
MSQIGGYEMKHRFLVVAFILFVSVREAKADYQVIVRADAGLSVIQPFVRCFNAVWCEAWMATWVNCLLYPFRM